MQTEHSPFPSDETLAAYIDGRLDEETRKRVVEHMAECEECFEVVMGAGELARPAAAPGRVVHWPRNLIYPFAAAAAVALVFWLTPLGDRVFPRDYLGALAAVAPPERYSDGRISGFPYRERAKTYRGGNEKPEDDITTNLPFLGVAAQVQERAAEHRNAETLHAEGVSQLALARDPKAVVKAVVTLEEALREQSHERDIPRAIALSSDARLLSDLAAAYIAVGRASDASTAAERAWYLSRTPEAAWNRAVAAEAQNKEIAIAKWREYLALDATPQWSVDAHKRLEGLTKTTSTP